MIDTWGNTLELRIIPVSECEPSHPISFFPGKQNHAPILVLDKDKTPSGRFTVVDGNLRLAKARAAGIKYISAEVIVKGWWEQ